jgi:CYTH domain-containing protein
MTQEIERKWWLPAIPDILIANAFETLELEQKYLRNDDTYEERVMLIRNLDKAYRTVKSKGGLVRQKGNFGILQLEYHQEQPMPGTQIVQKTCYRTHVTPLQVAELFVYGGHLAGLVTAEIEFDTIADSKAFIWPDILGPAIDVTHNPAYKNAYLATLTELPASHVCAA